MSETAVRPAWGPSHAGGASECGCKECGPGPGIDYASVRHNRFRTRQARLRVLLQRDDLTGREQQELDELLHLYILDS